MKRTAWPLGALLVLAGCGSSGGGGAQPGSDDAGGDAAGSVSIGDASDDAVDATIADDGAAADCASALPTSLACTGLYTDIVAKTIAPSAQSFTPAIPLWSDGSGKNRWVMLPAGQTIDRTDPNNWVFPAGTKFWKEFSRDGQRKETRFFHKQSDGTWVWVSYVWNDDESDAIATPAGASLPLEDGATYQVPTQQQCTECHNGRPEHIMGFEEVSLGSAGAAGLTLAQLASQGLLSPAPASTSLTIADDGSGDTAHALGWIHVNCGVTCHNANPLAGASSVSLRLRLDPTQLDGRSAAAMDPMVTMVGVPTSTGIWGQLDRIQPGDPDDSLLVYLVATRGAGKQMPPLASVYVDTPDVAVIRDWIAKMQPLDAGAGDAGSEDAGPTDAGTDAADSAAADAAVESGTGSAEAGASDAGGATDAGGDE
jgi:hypothetical protein